MAERADQDGTNKLLATEDFVSCGRREYLHRRMAQRHILRNLRTKVLYSCFVLRAAAY
jgi:hypothetical protein